jgi:cytochrome P450
MTSHVIDATEDPAADALLFEIFLDPAARANPYPRYRQLREQAPAFRSSMGSLVLSRYEDCLAVLGDPRFGRGVTLRVELTGYAPYGDLDPDPGLRIQYYEAAGPAMLFADPPVHSRLRRLASRAFTANRVRDLRPIVERMADELLDEAVERREVELIGEVALPLPIRVIGELVGVPVGDRSALQPLVRAAKDGLEPAATPEQLRGSIDAVTELNAYFGGLLEERERRPTDDLMSALVAARDADDRLTREEIAATAWLLFAAGYETTASLIGAGTLALLEHPGQQERWRRDPSLGPTAVDELLRWDSPVQVNPRIALGAVDMFGSHLEPGDSVLALQGGANRDPDRFAAPETLDLGRTDNQPLSFGWGIHHCLGAPLARMEGEVLLTGLLRRCSELVGLDEAPAWRGDMTVRGLAHLHVRLEA